MEGGGSSGSAASVRASGVRVCAPHPRPDFLAACGPGKEEAEDRHVGRKTRVERQKPVRPAANQCPEKPVTGLVRCDVVAPASAVPELPTDRGAEGGAPGAGAGSAKLSEKYPARLPLGCARRGGPCFLVNTRSRVATPRQGPPLLRPENGPDRGPFLFSPRRLRSAPTAPKTHT